MLRVTRTLNLQWKMLRRLPTGPIQLRLFSQSAVNSKSLKKLVKAASSTRDPSQIKGLAKEVSLKKRQDHHEIHGFKKERKPETALTRQHAASILSKLTGEEVDMNKLGPLSNEDIKYFPIAPRPVMYTLLGISENQLMDSLVVDTTAQRFINRDQLEKALMTARLAKDKGAVALNNIMKAYLKNNRVNDCIDLYTWRKKWGVPVTDHTLTVLFDGCANVRKDNKAGLTTNQVKKLKNILLSLQDSYHLTPNMIHMNSAFTALMNCPDQTIAMKLFDSWFSKEEPSLKSFSPDSRTYTILLKNLYLSEEKGTVSHIAEVLMARALNLPEKVQDRELYEAFVLVYLKQTTPELVKRAFEMVPKYFRLDHTTPNTDKLPKTPSDPTKFLELQELKEKFYPSVGLVDALVKKCTQLGDTHTALKISREFFETYPKSVDRAFLHRYLQALSESDEKEPGSEAIKVYQTVMDSTQRYSRVQPNHLTRLRVFLAIYKQSLRNLNHEGRLAVAKNAEMIFTLADDFFESIDPRHITAYEMYGYTKALRKVAFKPEERAKVLMRINSARFKFESQRGTIFAHDKLYDGYVSKILQFNKLVKEKHDIKPYLKKKDRLEKLKEDEREKVYRGFSQKDKEMLEKMKPRKERDDSFQWGKQHETR